MRKITCLLALCSLVISFNTFLNSRTHTVENKKMRKFKQEKLWRDKLPAYCEERGSVVHTKKLTDNEFDHELRIKLLEEAQEVKAAQTTDELVQELADLYEVIDTLAQLHGISKDTIIAAQEKKRNERGGFVGRSYVTFAEHPEGSYSEKYCLADPEKYPEVL